LAKAAHATGYTVGAASLCAGVWFALLIALLNAGLVD
jgi:hypothetical protein